MKQRPYRTIRWRVDGNWTITHEFYNSIRRTICGLPIATNIAEDIAVDQGPVECGACIDAHTDVSRAEHQLWTWELDTSQSYGCRILSKDNNFELEAYRDGSGVRIGCFLTRSRITIPSIDEFIEQLQYARTIIAEQLGEDWQGFGTYRLAKEPT